MISYAGVDWLTMTTKKDGPGEHWYRLYNEYRKDVIKDELREKRFNNGFYAGLSIGHLRWGYSERNGYILIASGHLAESYYERFKPAKHRTTRIDLCYDFELSQPRELIQNTYEYLLETQQTKFPKIAAFRTRQGGATLYIGSRSSAQYGRLYDKGVEQGTHEPGRKFRAEVEYKKPLSMQVAKQVSENDPKQRAADIHRTVWQWFSERLVELPGKPNSGQVINASYVKQVTSADKKLQWLRTQVAPTVIDLCNTGRGHEVMRALGFIDQAHLAELTVKVD